MNKRELDKYMTETARGDEEAFGLLYEHTRRGIYAFVYGYLKNEQDAEDVTQDVYIRIRRNAWQYKAGTDARAWMFQIAKNLSLNRLRERKREVPLHEQRENAMPVHNLPQGEVFDVMKRTLDAQEWEIVVLHLLWGYRHREIAEKLFLPTGTVTSKYKRALEKIKRAWEEA